MPLCNLIFFPYLGYFQLIEAVDSFIFLDDVSFIKRGWINRNRLCYNGEAHWFSVPLEKISQFRPINKTLLAQNLLPRWKKKFLTSLITFYKKQPYFAEGMDIVEKTLQDSYSSIANLSIASVKNISLALGIKSKFFLSSENEYINFSGADRIINICKKYNANEYINAPGGKNLYTRSMFEVHGIKLFFIAPFIPSIHDHGYIPGLSILDVIMRYGCQYISEHILQNYQLMEAQI